MNDEAPALDPFSCDDSAGPSAADDIVIHGLLSLLGPGEAAAIQRRLDRAIRAVRKDRARLHTRFFRRVAVASGTFALAAVIVLAIFFVPNDSDSQAFATLDSIRATPRHGTRVYRIRSETDASESSGDPRGRLPRQGTLVLGPEGRWTLSFAIPAQKQSDTAGPPLRQSRGQVVFGFDGGEYWMVFPNGVTRHAESLRELRPPLMLGALGAGVILVESETEDLEPLTLDAMLSQLDRGFRTTFQQPRGEGLLDGRPLSIVTFDRRGPSTGKGGPNRVRVVADAQTHEVLQAQWTWVNGEPTGDRARATVSREVSIERVEGANGSVWNRSIEEARDWFKPGAHSPPAQER